MNSLTSSASSGFAAELPPANIGFAQLFETPGAVALEAASASLDSPAVATDPALAHAATEAERAKLMVSSISKLKSELTSRGISFEGLVEKVDLVNALIVTRALPTATAAPVPLSAEEDKRIKKGRAAAAVRVASGIDSNSGAIELIVGRPCNGTRLGCKSVSTMESPHSACSACQTVYYCGQECQRTDWKHTTSGHGHKFECKKLAADAFAQNKKYSKDSSDSASAIYNLGCSYAAGRGVEVDFKKAIEHYTRSAEMGCKEAMTNLASAYGNGDYGLKQNWPLALKWFRAGAEAGDCVAMLNLAVRHLQGDGVPRSILNSVAWLRKAAAAPYHHQEACLRLGTMLWTGVGSLAQNQLEARDFFRIAAASPIVSTQACQHYGNCCRDGPGPIDLVEAAKYFKKGALAGDTDCMVSLGMAISNGSGVAQSYTLSREWYEKAAALGDRNAMSNLGNIHMTGRGGVPIDLLKAFRLHEKASALGHEQATYNVAAALWSGNLEDIGVPIDKKRGRELLERVSNFETAIIAGYSCKLLGNDCMVSGDFRGAERWFEKGKKLGDADSALNLTKVKSVEAEIAKVGKKYGIGIYK